MGFCSLRELSLNYSQDNVKYFPNRGAGSRLIIDNGMFVNEKVYITIPDYRVGYQFPGVERRLNSIYDPKMYYLALSTTIHCTTYNNGPKVLKYAHSL